MISMRAMTRLPAKWRPFTGAYISPACADGREIYVYGERVEDVHHAIAFPQRRPLRSQAHDALHDAQDQGAAHLAHRPVSGGFTHKFFRARGTRKGVCRARDAIAQWARMSYGWMVRSPD